MLRCLKWLPPACLLLFLLCFGLGWIVGKPPAPPVPIPPRQKQMSLIFLAYNKQGQQIKSIKVYINGNLIKIEDVNKQTYDISSMSHTVRIVPEDTKHYQEHTQDIVWRNKEDFVKWLDSGFQQELQARGANITPEQTAAWQKVLHTLKSGAAETSCYYPVILDPK